MNKKDSEPISEHLQQIGKLEKAESEVVKYFWNEIRTRAERMIGPELRKRLSASELASAALNSALGAVREGKQQLASRGRFEALVQTILQRKLVDEIRKTTAQKREPGQAAHLSPDNMAESQATAHQKVVASELAEQIAVSVLNEPKTTLQIINLLGFFGNFTAGQIAKILKSDNPDKEAPAPRTIQLQLLAMRLRLAGEFGVGDNEE